MANDHVRISDTGELETVSGSPTPDSISPAEPEALFSPAAFEQVPGQLAMDSARTNQDEK